MADELTVTVVSAQGAASNQIDLSRESAMVKAGLLYGDKVELVSLQAAAISTVAAAYVAPDVERRRLVEKIMSEGDPTSAAVLARLRELRRKRGKTPGEILDLAQLEELVRRRGDLIHGSLLGILGESGVAELMPAAEAGLLTLHPLGLDEGKGLDSGVAERFMEVVKALITPGSNAFPLLDDDAGKYARAIAGESGISLAIGSRAREVRLAGDLLESLPAFPHAPMSVVLEARAALRGSLVRFRSALITLARTIEEFPGDPDFRARVEDVWRAEVAPALAELQDAERERGLARLLVQSAAKASPTKVIEAGIAAVAAATNMIPVLVAAAVTAGVDTVMTAIERHGSVGKDMDGNRFLLLYEADRRLARK